MKPNWFLFSNHQKNVLISQLKLVLDPEPTQERYKNQSSRNGVTYQLLNLDLPKIFNTNSTLHHTKTSRQEMVLRTNCSIWTCLRSSIPTQPYIIQKIIDALALIFLVNLNFHLNTAKN